MLPDWLHTVLLIFVPVLDFAAATMVTVHAVLYKRDTRAVIGWVGLAWLAPIVGPLGYFMFGINRIQRRAVALRIRESHRWEPMITLSDDDRVRMEEIDCKYPGIKGLVLRAEFVRKRQA